MTKLSFLLWLDDVAHRLHAPGFVQRPLCDGLDRLLLNEDAHDLHSTREALDVPQEERIPWEAVKRKAFGQEENP